MIKVLDKGFVRVVDHMGNDASIVQAARVSYGEGTKTPSDDQKLINYLWKNKHTSPFEMCDLKVHVKCPIFVARQWLRHRTANVNEYSGRYSVMSPDYYVPDQFHEQGKKNKQKGDLKVPEHRNTLCQNILRYACDEAWKKYEELLKWNVAREEARLVLPVNFYTEFYWKNDLSNLLKFLTLRNDEHAQWEIQEFGRVLEGVVAELWPMVYQAYRGEISHALEQKEKAAHYDQLCDEETV